MILLLLLLSVILPYYGCEQVNESISLLMPWLTFLNLYICLASVQEQSFSFMMSCTTSAYILFDFKNLSCCFFINMLSSPTCILLRFPICFYLSVIKCFTIVTMHPIEITIISTSTISFTICLIVLNRYGTKIPPHAVSFTFMYSIHHLVVSLSSFLSCFFYPNTDLIVNLHSMVLTRTRNYVLRPMLSNGRCSKTSCRHA